jgi:hypothetical protein
MVFIICSSPLKTKGMDRKVVENKGLTVAGARGVSGLSSFAVLVLGSV